MNFTYDGYCSLLSLIEQSGYEIVNYNNWEDTKRCVILRHDVDNDLSKALKLAQVEQSKGVKSIYFILVTSDFYNIFSKDNSKKISEIIKCGHQIGLHFDETIYSIQSENKNDEVCSKILYEAKLLEMAADTPIKVVSMHRPSKEMLIEKLTIPGMINAYGSPYFDEFKYLSDSRRHWREPVEEIVASGKYDRLQILTHAFWYDAEEKDIHDTVKLFINSANRQRYEAYGKNFTDLASVMGINETC
ncbi:MAG: hypothetical protein J1F42_00865 [Lachnospiraceae bacterium]|nr:hypothetical protein [Lachnospiraceae bacterium]